MGEYCEEAFQNGILEMDNNIAKYGTPCPGEPKYDNRYWKCSDGVTRKITAMNDFQLIYAIRWINNGPYKRKMRERVLLMESELKRRGISDKDYFQVECQYWCDQNGKISKLSDMSTNHLERVLRFTVNSRYADKYKQRADNIRKILEERKKN